MNPKNPAAALTTEQVAALYLGNAITFPSGGPVALADQPETAGIRSNFYQKAAGRSVARRGRAVLSRARARRQKN